LGNQKDYQTGKRAVGEVEGPRAKGRKKTSWLDGKKNGK